MKKSITSREMILSTGREIIQQSGVQGLNMRGVADKSGVSVGTIYNYFPSKGDLVTGTIFSIWMEITDDFQSYFKQDNFIGNISSLCNSIEKGCLKYPSFLSGHSMSFANLDKSKGREVMNQYFILIKNILLESLDQDQHIRKEVFTKEFTKTDFIDFVFSNIVTAMRNEGDSCEFLLKVVRSIVY